MNDQSQMPAESGLPADSAETPVGSPTAAPIAEWLLAILACPSADRSPLTYQADVNELWCTGCDRAYPIRDGIPVLLVQEARHRSGGSDSGTEQGSV